MRMNLKYELLGRKIINQAADQHGIPAKTCRREIAVMIDEAWAHPTTEQMLLQKKLFPYGKPSPEEFIIVMAIELRNE